MNMIYIPDQKIYIEHFQPTFSDCLDEILLDLSYKSFDYWCSHFVSILQCLHYHVNLQNSPHNLTNYPNWSLQDLRGRNPYCYMQSIEPYLRNWSFQYFLINFLNSPLGINIATALREAIVNINDFKNTENCKYFRFQSAGSDSLLSNIEYLSDQKKFRDHNTQRRHVSYDSDLALCFSDKIDSSGTNILAFGEVEGNYGHKLLKEQFWDKKHPDLDFGVGVIKSKEPKRANKNFTSLPPKPKLTLNYFKHWSGYKAVVLIERDHNIVKDYHDAIQILIDIYYRGPNFRILDNLSHELKEICNLFKVGFDTPVIDLLKQFSYYSDFNNFIDPNAFSTNHIIRSDA